MKKDSQCTAPPPGDTNSARIARCRKVLDSLAAAGIAVAASGVVAGLLIAG